MVGAGAGAGAGVAVVAGVVVAGVAVRRPRAELVVSESTLCDERSSPGLHRLATTRRDTHPR